MDDAHLFRSLDRSRIKWLYRTNLAKGQTGLSIAFDLPTQTGFDPDAEQARGEVGKVGVPVAHLGHANSARQHPAWPDEYFDDDQRLAAWLLALYVANAAEQGVPSTELVAPPKTTSSRNISHAPTSFLLRPPDGSSST